MKKSFDEVKPEWWPDRIHWRTRLAWWYAGLIYKWWLFKLRLRGLDNEPMIEEEMYEDHAL